MNQEENQDFVLLTEEIQGEAGKQTTDLDALAAKRKHRKGKGRLLLTLFLLLAVGLGLFAYYKYQESKKPIPQDFTVDLTQEVTAKAYVWLAQIEDFPYTYEELQQKFGAVYLEITQTPMGDKPAFENWVAKGSYEKTQEQVAQSLLTLYKEILTMRLQQAGFQGELTDETLDTMMQEAYGIDVETYLKQYGPELLPTFEACKARYAQEVAYE